MKVILKQDVKTIGKKDGIYEVSDGYARNYLLPRGLAAAADASALNVARTKQQAKEHHEAEQLAAARELAARIQDKTFKMAEKGGASGKLYGKITAKELAAVMSSQLGTEIDKRKIVLERDIKEFGVHSCAIKLMAGVSATFKVQVEEQK